ncbi:hypothetical protein AgCh_036903 [Apium graveolens]
MVEAWTGQKVQSGEMRLHLDKTQLNKDMFSDVAEEQAQNEGNEELQLLEQKRRLLSEKIKRIKEIIRLQREFSEMSESYESFEYQTKEHDSTLNPSKQTEYSEYDECTGSLYWKMI